MAYEIVRTTESFQALDIEVSNPSGPIPFGNLKTVADNIVDLVEPA